MKTARICANRIAAFLDKEPRDFTRPDLIKNIRANGVKIVDFLVEKYLYC